MEGNASYYTTYSMCIIIPSIIGAACFQPLFRKLNNKGRTASLFALFTGCLLYTSIARALVNRPEIIFADEPTGNLDSKTSDEVIALLKMLSLIHI